MVFRRHSREEGESGSGVPDQDPSDLERYVLDRISLREIENFFEPRFREWVQEEVEGALSRIPGLSQWSGLPSNPTGTSGGAVLKLRFVNNLPATLFTVSSIKAVDESPVAIELIDSRTNTRVATGPLSSAKALILVLDGDYDPDNGEDRNEGEFNSRTVREREGRRPLITGDLSVKLHEGLGYLGSIMFTDNSSWIRSRKFRLGAQILQKVPTDMRVKEALSGSFVVKDHRGEGYQKHYPPNLKDDIWRLENIAKDGVFHTRLASQGIHKVEDFLRLLETNQSLLRTIIGQGQRISNRTWEAIVAHARTCMIHDDNQAFIYLQESTNIGLLFNSVYKLLKVTFDGHHTYIPVDRLTPDQVALVRNLKLQAYANTDRLIPVGGALGVNNQQALSGLSLETFLAPQGYSPMPSDSTQYGSNSLGSQQPEVSGPQKYVHPEHNFAPTIANSFLTGDVGSEVYNGRFSFPSSSQGPAMLNGENIARIEISTCFPSTSDLVPENSFFFGSPSVVAKEGGTFPNLPEFASLIDSSNMQCQSLGVHIHGRKVRSRVAWCKIRAAFKFRSIRNAVARKRHMSGSAARSMSCF